MSPILPESWPCVRGRSVFRVTSRPAPRTQPSGCVTAGRASCGMRPPTSLPRTRQATARASPSGCRLATSARSGIESLRLLLAMARLRGWRRLRDGSDIVREIDGRRRHHVPGPHYYLEALAVDVGRQGRGTGTALMRATLEQIRRCRPPRVSRDRESPDLAAVSRGSASSVVDTLTLPDAGIDCWMLRRPPAGSSVTERPGPRSLA